MYLSRIEIDSRKHETMRAFYNLEVLHSMVENSFSEKRQRNLWRIDRLYGKDYLLLLSPIPPQNNILPEQIGIASARWETKEYEKLLARVLDGTKWRFRVTTNPTVARVMKAEQRGKVKAITVVPRQKECLIKQSEKKGFFLQ